MPKQPRTAQAAPSDKKDFYSTLEAAELLGVSFQTVARWMDRGYLSGWRTPGGHRLISAASLEEVLRKGRTAPAGEPATPVASAATRFLIVDDSDDDLHLLRASIKSAFPGADVAQADNAFAALLSIGQSPPDVLITDIMMPDVDGVEMIRSLRENPHTSSVLVMVVSNYREKAITQRFGPLPKDVLFLSKPVEPEALRKLLAEPLARPRG